jgi:hypothetical protein
MIPASYFWCEQKLGTSAILSAKAETNLAIWVMRGIRMLDLRKQGLAYDTMQSALTRRAFPPGWDGGIQQV